VNDGEYLAAYARGEADVATEPDGRLWALAWRQFVCFEGTGLYCSDRAQTSDAHRAHAPSNGRYVIVAFTAATAEVLDCDLCGEPGGLLRGDGRLDILLSTDNIAEAMVLFEVAAASLLKGEWPNLDGKEESNV